MCESTTSLGDVHFWISHPLPLCTLGTKGLPTLPLVFSYNLQLCIRIITVIELNIMLQDLSELPAAIKNVCRLPMLLHISSLPIPFTINEIFRSVVFS